MTLAEYLSVFILERNKKIIYIRDIFKHLTIKKYAYHEKNYCSIRYCFSWICCL